MVKATYHSIRYKTETPRLLLPLAFASLAITIESLYFLVANLYRYYIDPDVYFALTSQDNVFAVKVFIAISGVLMMLKLRSERKK
jgi:peptidoglycan/LPS O-acetylase OafA/YrhL